MRTVLLCAVVVCVGCRERLDGDVTGFSECDRVDGVAGCERSAYREYCRVEVLRKRYASDCVADSDCAISPYATNCISVGLCASEGGCVRR